MTTGELRHSYAVSLVSAILLLEGVTPQTTAHAQFKETVKKYYPPAFVVRSYQGKCLDFGPPPYVNGSPVYIFECNGTGAQQIVVQEINGRHEVILRAGAKVIGVQQPADDYRPPPAAPAASAAVVPERPLELQDESRLAVLTQRYIFTLDGDSIVLAANHSLVVKIQNARSLNRTPLVLGQRDVADSEFWDFVAIDGTSPKPTSGFIPVSNIVDLVKALQSPTPGPGTVIEIDQGVSLETPHLEVPEGVTIRGNRRGTQPGPELWTSDIYAKQGMLEISGNDVRITGLRLRGPSRDINGDDRDSIGILAHDNLYTRSIVDHNDISQWTHAGVLIRAEDDSTACHPDDPDPRLRPYNVVVARNFIHHNERINNGYGVSTYYGGYALIEGNTFVSNRHSVTGEDGRARTSFRAWHNLVLEDGPLQHGLYHTQDFDMHGTGSTWYEDHVGGTGGQYVEIAGNTFLGTNRENFDLRGTPCFLAEFHHNVSLESHDDAVVDEGDASKLIVGSTPNQFDYVNPTNQLGVGDFDGDGKQDVFLATGAAWYYAPAGQAEWRFLNAQSDGIAQLRFGDFDGDGRTDVFTQHGRDWLVSWGGVSPWEKINESKPALPDFAIGDFDGDRRADVFYADGQTWWISYGGVGPFQLAAASGYHVPDLRFGDFNGDGRTDVFSVGNAWQVSYGATTSWASLPRKLTDNISNLIVADFDGDGRADVGMPSITIGAGVALDWKISRGGTSDWTTTRLWSSTAFAQPPPVAATGRFDDSPGADLLLWGSDEHLYLFSSGTAARGLYSRQDMR